VGRAPSRRPPPSQALFRKARARFRKELAPPDAPPEVDYNPEDLPQTPLALLALAVLAAHGRRVVQSQGTHLKTRRSVVVYSVSGQPAWEGKADGVSGADG
jgi:MYXO-CTERM domain-containing protein